MCTRKRRLRIRVTVTDEVTQQTDAKDDVMHINMNDWWTSKRNRLTVKQDDK